VVQTASLTGTDSPQAPQPIVSVIIPVWNVEPYLRQCLDSVMDQTIGPDRLEVIAINDGSLDGSGALLNEYVARYPQLKVIHEPNSGGPGRPRNIGLDNSTGRYVFFLDADDYLGREALERLVAMAERNRSDIVLGKMVGVDGRPVPTRAFRRNRDRADLAEVYSTLGVLKLFRRSLIERLGLRFAEGVAGGEDAPFTERAYLEANVISVVADYNCYYTRLRTGSQSKSTAREDDLLDALARRADRIELLAAHRGPGADRDRLMARHIWDVVRAFSWRWLALEPAEREHVFNAAAALIQRWNNDVIQAQLAPPVAIRAYCLQHGLRSELEDIVACSPRKALGDPIIDGRRVFARYPHFRDSSGIPDSCFELTNRIKLRRRATRAELGGTTLQLSGEAYLTYLGGDTTVILRRGPLGPEFRCPTMSFSTPQLRDRYRAYPNAGFTTTIDLATAADGRSLKRGLWEVLLSVGRNPVRRTARFKRPPDFRAATDARTANDAPAALYTTPRGALRIRVGAVGPITKWLEQADLEHRLRRRRRRVSRQLRRLPRRARAMIQR
jgi:glycosyltransferase involved in cell wall biosynthesis